MRMINSSHGYAAFAFFFQAEDGIRDLVRSRGLGDVYKRQVPRPVSAISRVLLGDWVTTQARVSRLAPFKGGIRIGLAGDEGSELTMTLFDSVWTAVPLSLIHI